MISVIYAVLALLYVLTASLVLVGLYRRWPRLSSEPLKSASVIICARDEEKDLPACLESLEAQVLDPGTAPLEVILVDDVSRDRTAQLMNEYAGSSRHQVRVLHMSPPGPDEPSGKWRPLKEGMRIARNEGLLLTDADAVLPPRWVTGHLRELGAADLSTGFILIEGKGIWNSIQCLDWLFLTCVGNALSQWGLPQSAFGKNLALRRSEYLAVGGLESVGFSITEDLALVRAMIDWGNRMVFSSDKDLAVTTQGAGTLFDFLKQRTRWLTGFRHLKTTGKTILVIAVLRNFAIIAGILTGSFAAVWIWVASAVLNYLILWQRMTILGVTDRMKHFIFWEVFYTWTAPLLAWALFKYRKTGWRGRQLT